MRCYSWQQFKILHSAIISLIYQIYLIVKYLKIQSLITSSQILRMLFTLPVIISIFSVFGHNLYLLDFSVQFSQRLTQYQNCQYMNQKLKQLDYGYNYHPEFNKFFDLSPKKTQRNPSKLYQVTHTNPFSPKNQKSQKYVTSMKLIRYASDSQIKMDQPKLKKQLTQATENYEKRSVLESKHNPCHLSFIVQRQARTQRNKNFCEQSGKYCQKSSHTTYYTEINSKNRKNNKTAKDLKDTSSTSSADINCKQYLNVPSFLKAKSMKNSFVNKEDFSIIKKLGVGKFCSVYLIKDKKTGFIMAMKEFKKEKIIKQKALQQFIREIKIQSFLNHPNIIKIYGFFHDQANFNVLLELGSHGQLFNFLKQSKKRLSEEAIFYIAKQLLGACNYMHSLQILHRDVKPENLVLTHGIVKLCDFGWSVRIQQQLRDTYCGTPLYFSPELLKGELYDEKVDIWATGVLLYELFTGQSPFQIEQRQDIFKIVTQSFRRLPPQHRQLQDFISQMLIKNPQKRLSSQQLLKFPILKRYAPLETCEQLLS